MTIEERIRERVGELGRPLTPQELIEVVNTPPDTSGELTYEYENEAENDPQDG